MSQLPTTFSLFQSLLNSDTKTARRKERLVELQRSISQSQDTLGKLNEVRNTLEDLPSKLTHKVMIPINSRALVPGIVYNTNEIMVHLGEDIYCWKTVNEAVDVALRRETAIKRDLKNANDELQAISEELEKHKQFLALHQEMEDDDIKEIRETYENDESFWQSYHVAADSSPAVKEDNESGDELVELDEEDAPVDGVDKDNIDDVLSRLQELEAQEALMEDFKESKIQEKEKSPTAKKQPSKSKGSSMKKGFLLGEKKKAVKKDNSNNAIEQEDSQTHNVTPGAFSQDTLEDQKIQPVVERAAPLISTPLPKTAVSISPGSQLAAAQEILERRGDKPVAHVPQGASTIDGPQAPPKRVSRFKQSRAMARQ